MKILDGRTVLVPIEGLVVEALDDGAVIWNGQTERLHVLDVPGRELWERLHPCWTLAEVFADVAKSFSTDPALVRRDAMPFFADLVTAGLLVTR